MRHDISKPDVGGNYVLGVHKWAWAAIAGIIVTAAGIAAYKLVGKEEKKDKATEVKNDVIPNQRSATVSSTPTKPSKVEGKLFFQSL